MISRKLSFFLLALTFLFGEDSDHLCPEGEGCNAHPFEERTITRVVYAPIVRVDHAPKMCVEIWSTKQIILDALVFLGLDCVRINTASTGNPGLWVNAWGSERTDNPVLSDLDYFDQQVQDLLSVGYTDITVVLQNAPQWTLADITLSMCSEIDEDYWDEYALFINMLADEWPEVTYWEIGNEVDMNERQFANNPHWVFGCWGNKDKEIELERADAYWRMFDYLQRNTYTNLIPSGMSMISTEDAGFLEASLTHMTPPHVNFHHYDVFGYPGGEEWTLPEKVRYIREAFPTSVIWLNETSFILPSNWQEVYETWNPPGFLLDQQDYYYKTILQNVDRVYFYVVAAQPAWRGTGMWYYGAGGEVIYTPLAHMIASGGMYGVMP